MVVTHFVYLHIKKLMGQPSKISIMHGDFNVKLSTLTILQLLVATRCVHSMMFMLSWYIPPTYQNVMYKVYVHKLHCATGITITVKFHTPVATFIDERGLFSAVVTEFIHKYTYLVRLHTSYVVLSVLLTVVVFLKSCPMTLVNFAFSPTFTGVSHLTWCNRKWQCGVDSQPASQQQFW